MLCWGVFGMSPAELGMIVATLPIITSPFWGSWLLLRYLRSRRKPPKRGSVNRN